jgi:hypothetical protein
VKINPEAQLKMCRFQFMKLKANNDLLCEAINLAEESLKFYAHSEHIEDLQDDLENPSGEPENWVCDSGDKFNLENGGFARLALEKIKTLKEKLK